MIELPKSTEYSKILHKTKLFEQPEFRGKIKQALVDDVAKIIISNKIAENTLNIDKGLLSFTEILILKIELKKATIDTKLLDAIDRSIRSSFIIFLLEYNNEKKISIAYKEKYNGKIKVVKRWFTGWSKELTIGIIGSSVDTIYKNFIAEISGYKLPENSNSLKEYVEYVINIEKLEKQIVKLTTKMKKEPQFKKQIEIKRKIESLKEQLCQRR